MGLFHTTHDIIGKSIQIENAGYFISGIFKELPRNSTQQYDFILPFEKIKEDYPSSFADWANTGPRTFVVLNPNTNVNLFREKIKNYIKNKDTNSNTTLIIQQYSKTYLYNNYENGLQSGGRIEYVNLLSIIAFFLLLIACINFMNLSTAKASNRFKEIGIKKVIGIERKSLIIQYLSESTLITFMALIIAIIIVENILPQFNLITGKQITFSLNFNVIMLFLVITLFTGLISGSYPALYLSGFKPIEIFKGKVNNKTGSLIIRKGLVVFQFFVSAILISAVLIVYKQIEYMQNRNLGYNKENLVYLLEDGKLLGNASTFIDELKKLPGVLDAGSSDHNLMGHVHTTSLTWNGKNENESISFEFAQVGYDAIETLGIKLKAGRSFSRNYGDESNKIILNEAAVNSMNLEDPIGKTIYQWGIKKEIIGVVKNFNYESLHTLVKPMFFMFNPKECSWALVRIKKGMEQETIAQIQNIYEVFNPEYSFYYRFIDEDYQTLYETESRVSILSKYFAGLAIIISCLGLFGLTSFTAEKRRKEIGIRKVLGSSEIKIIYLLSSDFTKLVFIGILIASPLSYFLTKNWLEGFAYSISLTSWYFISSGLIILVIAWLTVGFQAIKAATANPIESLKYE